MNKPERIVTFNVDAATYVGDGQDGGYVQAAEGPDGFYVLVLVDPKGDRVLIPLGNERGALRELPRGHGYGHPRCPGVVP